MVVLGHDIFQVAYCAATDKTERKVAPDLKSYNKNLKCDIEF